MLYASLYDTAYLKTAVNIDFQTLVLICKICNSVLEGAMTIKFGVVTHTCQFSSALKVMHGSY